MKKNTGKKKGAALDRKKYCSELKINRPLGVAFRRANIVVKEGRAKYFEYEKKVFFMDGQRCTVEAFFHITCIN